MKQKISKIFDKVDLKKMYLMISVFSLIIIFLLQFFDIYSILLGIVIFLLVNIACKVNIPKFPLVLFIIAFLIRVTIVSIFNTLPVSDFSVILDAAKNLLNNVNVMNDNSYFFRNAYQTGPVLYIFSLLKIFNSVYFLKIVNCIFSSINCVFIFYISKKISNEKGAKRVSLLYGLLPFSIFFNTVLSNQIPASTFFYLALYLIIYNENSIKNYIFGGILLSIGNFLRTEGVIFLLSIIGFYLLLLLSKKATKKMHIGILLMIVLYFSLNFLSSLTIKITGINNEGLTNNYTSWKFILGLNINTCGTYNDNDSIYLQSKEIAKQEAINRFKNLTPVSFVNLISCKAKITWRGESLVWTFSDLDREKYIFLGKEVSADTIQFILTGINQFIYYLTFCLMIIGLYHSYRNKNQFNHKILLFVNVLAINFIVYSFIEVQTRYIYLLQISIFILASLSENCSINIFKTKDKFINSKY